MLFHCRAPVGRSKKLWCKAEIYIVAASAALLILPGLLLLLPPPLQLRLEEVGWLHAAGLVHPVGAQPAVVGKADANKVEVWTKGAGPGLPVAVVGQRVGAIS